MKKLLLSLGAIASVAAPVAAVVACGSNPLQDPAKELVINEAKTNNVVAALNGFRTFKVGEDTYTLVDDDPTKFSEVVTYADANQFAMTEADQAQVTGLDYNYFGVEAILHLQRLNKLVLDRVTQYQFDQFPAYVKNAIKAEAAKVQASMVKATGAAQVAALADYNSVPGNSEAKKLEDKAIIKFNDGFNEVIKNL